MPENQITEPRNCNIIALWRGDDIPTDIIGLTMPEALEIADVYREKPDIDIVNIWIAS